MPVPQTRWRETCIVRSGPDAKKTTEREETVDHIDQSCDIYLLPVPIKFSILLIVKTILLILSHDTTQWQKQYKCRNNTKPLFSNFSSLHPLYTLMMTRRTTKQPKYSMKITIIFSAFFLSVYLLWKHGKQISKCFKCMVQLNASRQAYFIESNHINV